MGAFLDRPKTDKYNECGLGKRIRYGLSSMQGWRTEMEDAHTAIVSLAGLPDWSFFAVFDGHAGSRVSAYCAEQLLNSILANEAFRGFLSEGDNSRCNDVKANLDEIKQGIRDGFLKLDDEMRELPEMVSGKDKSGSTAVCTMISPDFIFFANCGDSRAVLSRGGEDVFTTEDHKPVNPVERERIQRAGGSVVIQRVNGSLAVSRALGDFEYKNTQDKGPCEQLVSPEPEICVWERDPAADEFLVLACDGIWDVMTNKDLCNYVRHQLTITSNLEDICNSVVDMCFHKDSKDNMSMVIVALDAAPKVSPEAVQKDKDLDIMLESKIKAILSDEEVSPSDVIKQFVIHNLFLEEDSLPGLPPGGGLVSKKKLIYEIIDRLAPPEPSILAASKSTGSPSTSGETVTSDNPDSFGQPTSSEESPS